MIRAELENMRMVRRSFHLYRPGLALGVIFLMIFLILLCPVQVRETQAASPVGKFTHIEGEVDVLRGGKLPAVVVKVGDLVYEKDVIRTKRDSRAAVAFNDGNSIRMAMRSRVDISEYVTEGMNRAVLDLPRGKINAEVALDAVKRIALDPKLNRFQVRTPNAVAGVRGTNFIVFHELNVTGVVVTAGTVVTYNPRFPEVTVTVAAGQTTTVLQNKPPEPAKAATKAEIEKHQRDVAPTEKPNQADAGELPGLVGIVAAPEPPPQPPPPPLPPPLPVVVVPVTEVVRVTTPPTVTFQYWALIRMWLYGGTGLIGETFLNGLMGGISPYWLADKYNRAPTFIRGSFTPGPETGPEYGLSYILGHDSRGGFYHGYLGVLKNSDLSLSGRFTGFYASSAADTQTPTTRQVGFLLGDFATGRAYPGIGMFEMDGGLYPVEFENLQATAVGLLERLDILEPPNTVAGGSFTGGGSIEWDGHAFGFSASLHLSDSERTDWGIFTVNLWGAWSGTSSDTWNFKVDSVIVSPPDDDTYTRLQGLEIAGSRWSDNILEGSLKGFFAEVGQINAQNYTTSGIMIGETKGTFNANRWTADMMGISLSTERFLSMASTEAGRAKLAQLNIPAVEVGRVTMTGQGNGFNSLNMNDVAFFAPSTGARPGFWATAGGVTGDFTQAPDISTATPIPITLTGGGLSAYFTFRHWDAANGQWLSTITNGTGSITGGGQNVQYLQFQGAGAGTIIPGTVSGTGTITGTAAGVAK